MGRIRTSLIKRITKKLMAEHGDELSKDFTKNKEVVAKYTNIGSPKIKNVVSGYAARLAKQKEEGESGITRRRIPKSKKEDLSKYYKK